MSNASQRRTYICDNAQRYLVVLACSLLLIASDTQATVPTSRSIMDDYTPTSTYDTWYYSRIGTDRGAMGDGDFQVSIGGGAVTVSVTSGWAGVWTSLLHRGADSEDGLNPLQLLGPYVLPAY